MDWDCTSLDAARALAQKLTAEKGRTYRVYRHWDTAEYAVLDYDPKDGFHEEIKEDETHGNLS